MARKVEISAGLLVYRRVPGLEVLLAHPGGPFWAKRDDGVWTIPKGLVESGDLLACARREFTEETGLVVEGDVAVLTPTTQKSGKVVHAYAVESDLDLAYSRSNSFRLEWPPRSRRWQEFPEVDRLAYFDLEAANRKILSYQRPWLEELAQILGPK